MSEENKEMIERMQYNGIGWNWLDPEEQQCIKTNWDQVDWHNGEFWVRATSSLDMVKIGMRDIFRISPDWKPEPVTRYFADVTDKRLPVAIFIGAQEGHLKDMPVEEYCRIGGYLPDYEASDAWLEVTEQELPYLSKPEVTEEMKAKGEDWVFRKTQKGDEFMDVHCHPNTGFNEDYVTVRWDNSIFEGKFNGHRWVKVCAEPKSDLHADALALMTATRDNLIKTLNNDMEAVLKMIKEQA